MKLLLAPLFDDPCVHGPSVRLRRAGAHRDLDDAPAGSPSAGGFDRAAAEAIIEAVGLLAAAVVALQISQTIAEEEVIRDAHISAPTRVRRFLSRFMVVIVVAIAVEGLVAIFRAHEDPAHCSTRRASCARSASCSSAGACSCASTAMRKSWSLRRWQRPSRKTGN